MMNNKLHITLLILALGIFFVTCSSTPQVDKPTTASPDFALNRIVSYLNWGQYQNAIDELNSFISFYGERSDLLSIAYGYRGDAYFELRNYIQAIEEYTNAIGLTPSEDRYNKRGLAYSANGNSDAAIRDYIEAIRLSNDSNPSLFYNRGLEYYKKSDYDNAIADLNSAPKDTKTNQLLALSYKGRGIINYNKGEGYSEARSYYNQACYTNAIDDFNKAIEFDPRLQYAFDSEVKSLLALSYMYRGFNRHLAGLFAAAIADYELALRYDSKLHSDIDKRHRRAQGGHVYGGLFWLGSF